MDIESTHCLDTAAVRCWIAFQAGTALTNDPAGAIARLRALRGLARELDDPEAVEALTGAIRPCSRIATANGHVVPIVMVPAWTTTLRGRLIYVADS